MIPVVNSTLDAQSCISTVTTETLVRDIHDDLENTYYNVPPLYTLLRVNEIQRRAKNDDPVALAAIVDWLYNGLSGNRLSLGTCQRVVFIAKNPELAMTMLRSNPGIHPTDSIIAIRVTMFLADPEHTHDVSATESMLALLSNDSKRAAKYASLICRLQERLPFIREIEDLRFKPGTGRDYQEAEKRFTASACQAAS